MLRNATKRLDEGTRKRRKRQYLESLEYDNANGSLQFEMAKFNQGRSEKIYLKRSTRRGTKETKGRSTKSKYKEASDSDEKSSSSEEEIDELDSQTQKTAKCENGKNSKNPEKTESAPPDISTNSHQSSTSHTTIQNTNFMPIPNSEHNKTTEFHRKTLKERLKDDHTLRSTENTLVLLKNMDNNPRASRVASLLLNQDLPLSYKQASYYDECLAPKSKKVKSLKPCMVCGKLKSPYNCIVCGFLICSVNCKNTHKETRCEKYMR
jgi:hypothetical protein